MLAQVIQNTQPLMSAFLAGLLPALFWLFFWLKEDKLHPEPKKIIALSFLAGMLVVLLVIPVEKFARDILSNYIVVVIVWVAIEEVFKYAAAYIIGISRKCDDEPIDSVIYLITVALGFAAIENALFLASPLMSGQISTALITGAMRFVGSTLLHTVASATLGIFIAYAFYHSRKYKFIFTVLGLFAAIIMHSIFNLILIKGIGSNTMIAFYFVWIMVVSVLVFFEKVKKIKDPRSDDLSCRQE